MIRNKIMAGLSAFTPTTWNSADKVSNIVLSSANLNATMPTAGASAGLCRTTLSRATGRFYWEGTVNNGSASATIYFGIARGSLGTGNLLNVSGSASYCDNGIITINGSGSAPISDWQTGDVISVALDLTSSLVFFRKNNNSWNENGSSPTTGSGGFSISSLAGVQIFPAISFNGSGPSPGAAVTANFGATSFSFSVPSGFTSGFG